MKTNYTIIAVAALFVCALVQVYTIDRLIPLFRSRQSSPSAPLAPSRPRKLPINITTQGVGHYTQLGILHNGSETILPLMGRQTHIRSHMWNYYTLTNDALPVRIPLSTNGRSCDTSNGCNELYSGDSVLVPELGGKFTVKLYDRTPRYIPYLY